MKLHINTNNNDINVGIRMSATRTYGNKVYGYYEVNYSAPVVEGEGYELRPNPCGEGISVYVNGNEVKTYATGRKGIASAKFDIEFESKEQAEQAAEIFRQHKDVFIQMFRNKKVDIDTIKAMVA